jgi:hypothetical protein
MLLLKGIQNSAIAIGATYLGVAIGTNNTAENINQNGLIAEAQRVASTNTISTTTVTNDTSEHEGNFTISSSTLAVVEAGVSTTTDTGGDFPARQVFPVMNFVQNDNLIIVFKFVTS